MAKVPHRTTRTGKIARLPLHIRDKLNSRLDDGESGKALVNWLNGLKEVKRIMAETFAARPINEQNLTEWKQGGFLDWQRRQDACQRVRALTEFSDDLDTAADDQSIAERLAPVLAAELASETQKLLEESESPQERWRCLCDALRQLNWLRARDHAAARETRAAERWEIECKHREQLDLEKLVRDTKAEAEAPIWDALRRPTIASFFGGGEAGEKAADFLIDMATKARRATSPHLSARPAP